MQISYLLDGIYWNIIENQENFKVAQLKPVFSPRKAAAYLDHENNIYITFFDRAFYGLILFILHYAA